MWRAVGQDGNGLGVLVRYRRQMLVANRIYRVLLEAIKLARGVTVRMARWAVRLRLGRFHFHLLTVVERGTRRGGVVVIHVVLSQFTVRANWGLS